MAKHSDEGDNDAWPATYPVRHRHMPNEGASQLDTQPRSNR